MIDHGAIRPSATCCELSATVMIGDQSRVAPLPRAGCRACSTAQTRGRFASIATSRPACRSVDLTKWIARWRCPSWYRSRRSRRRMRCSRGMWWRGRWGWGSPDPPPTTVNRQPAAESSPSRPTLARAPPMPNVPLPVRHDVHPSTTPLRFASLASGTRKPAGQKATRADPATSVIKDWTYPENVDAYLLKTTRPAATALRARQS